MSGQVTINSNAVLNIGSAGDSDGADISERVRQTTLMGLTPQQAMPISATDQILTALAKLQSQLNEDNWNWVNCKDMGYFKVVDGQPYLEEYYIGDVGGFWFCVKDGVLYIKGMLTVLTNFSSNSELFVFNNSDQSPFFPKMLGNSTDFYVNGIIMELPEIKIPTMRIEKHWQNYVFLGARQSVSAGQHICIPPIAIGYV